MNYFIKSLPFVTIPTTLTGFAIGLYNNHEPDILYPHHQFFNIIGITSIGFFTGLIYPISFPLLGIRYLYKTH